MRANAERCVAGVYANWLYALTLAVAALGLVATLGALFSAYRSIHVGAAAAHHVVLVGVRLTYPRVNLAGAAILTLACVGFVVLVRGACAVLRLARDQRGFLSGLALCASLPDTPQVLVFADERPQAFCAGYLRARVYVSTATLEVLHPIELRAVLAHEREHLKRHDPLRIALARVLAHALFFLPALARLVERYGDLAELRADASAIHESHGNRAPLASALLAFGDGAHPGVGIAPDRVDHLLGRPVASDIPRGWIMGAALTLAVAVIATVVAGQSASTGLTLNLPWLSEQPCVLVLAAIPLIAAAVALPRLRHGAH